MQNNNAPVMNMSHVFLCLASTNRMVFDDNKCSFIDGINEQISSLLKEQSIPTRVATEMTLIYLGLYTVLSSIFFFLS